MKIVNNLTYLSLDGCVAALGTFDGLHIGHQTIIEATVNIARKKNLPSLVFSFSNHPLDLLNPQYAPTLLLEQRDKHALLNDLGVDILLSIDFNRQTAELTPDKFIDALCTSINPQSIVVGENFTYGKKGCGNVQTLAREAYLRKIDINILPLLSIDGHPVSSTSIRTLITQGNMSTAKLLLGRTYKINGAVQHGSKLGRTMDLPTANINLEGTRLTIPAVGGYAVEVWHKGNKYFGVANIGFNPTVATRINKRLEVHILNFNQQIYGDSLDVLFHHRLCDETKFANITELKNHIQLQKERTQQFFKL